MADDELRMDPGSCTGTILFAIIVLGIHIGQTCFDGVEFVGARAAIEDFPAAASNRRITFLPTRGIGKQAALILEMPHQRWPVGFLGRRIGFGDEAGTT